MNRLGHSSAHLSYEKFIASTTRHGRIAPGTAASVLLGEHPIDMRLQGEHVGVCQIAQGPAIPEIKKYKSSDTAVTGSNPAKRR